MLIDSHAHLTDRNLISNICEVRNGYLSSGVKIVVDVGCSLNSSLTAFNNAQKYSEVYFTAGIHPDDAGNVNSQTLKELSLLLKEDKCVALGETGLDYHYLNFDKEVQKKAFVSQIELAIKEDMPLIVHSRDAWGDTVDILTNYSKNLKRGFLMHCYSGSMETAKTLLDLGGYFAFGGVITFKNAKKDEILKSIPIDRLFLETDCPYMAPVPYRGNLNKPEYIIKTYEKTAEILGVSREYLEEVIFNNFYKFFKI